MHRDAGSDTSPARFQIIPGLFQSFLNMLPDAALVIDRHNRIRAANKAAQELWAYASNQMIGRSIGQVLHGPPDRGQAGWVGHVVSNGKFESESQCDLRALRSDGREVPVEIHVRKIQIDDRPLNLIMVHDISELRRTQSVLSESEAMYEALVENIADAVVVNVGPRRVFVNQAYLTLHGLADKSEALGLPVDHFIVPEDRDLVLSRTLARQKGQIMPGPYVYRIQRKDGEIRTVETSPVKIRYRGQPAALSVLRDVTDRARAEARLSHLASHDALTGVLNRASFEEELERCVSVAGSVSVLIFLDVDNLKHVNDTYGHRTGDAYLCQLAKALQGQVKNTQMIGRIGGDEFAVLLPGSTVAEAQATARRMLQALRSIALPYETDGVPVTASVGIACAPKDASSGQDLLRCADIAMYAAKRRGGDQLAMFDPKLSMVA